MKYILAGLFLFTSSTSYCQAEQYQYYFDKDLKITSPSEALFTGTGKEVGGQWLLTCYNKKNNDLILKMHFTDLLYQ